ncbi:Uroporphyrin-III methyltransferase [Rubrivivax sp. A210]|uniref:SAM-dependent methyltransferase n=1 Tax=Rubrivivax sp. A210 TaxID=2772301 RepID=UPI0019197C90|nr:SAM-dependent methyltransferase [Rubrivivax sp. A210]CAD5370683.1 Uroporphyrin-III methyltransferase [Rubrivivax sp. A210]
MTSRGNLVLMPNALDLGADEVPLADILPAGVMQRAAALAHWVAEDARSARALLKRVGAHFPLALPLQQIAIKELPRPRKGSREAVPAAEWAALLQPALDGHDIGLVSEAGLPAVADPGALLVAAAHEAGLTVLPLPGPSSLLLALAASGMNGQSFAFVGYLPQEPAARALRLRELEALSRRLGQTQILIETPYRNAALLATALEALAPATRLSISCGLTLVAGWTRSDRVSAWRARPQALPDKLPAVFCLLAG